VSQFSSLEIGRLGLLAQQRALGVTSNNVANVNTPGYTRQRAQLDPISTDAGGGVRVSSVNQLIDTFVEARITAQNSDLGSASAQQEIMNRVEALFPTEGPSIATALRDFFDAANQLSASPEDIAARQSFLDRANALTSQLNGTYGGIASLQRETDSRLVQGVKDINQLLKTIADLNKQIGPAEIDGTPANELRDQRRNAVNKLADLIQVQTRENADGTLDVFANNGTGLVVGQDARLLASGISASSGLDGLALDDVGLDDGYGNVLPVPGNFGGRLGALQTLRDQTLPSLAGDLDTLATSLRDQVNGVQTNPAGRDLDGLVGGNLFTGTGAGDIAVAITDPRKIAAAQSTNTGDNTNALALVALGTASIGTLGNQTFGDYYGTVEGRVGGLVSAADQQLTMQQNVASTLASQRDAVSGVSIEEESVQLIQFQRAFQACAQLISVSDQLLQDVMGIIK
jgi:flagellar hook-associated protein 1